MNKTLLVLAALALIAATTPAVAADDPVCVEDTCTPGEDEDLRDWAERELGLGPCHCPPPGNEPLPL